MTLETFLILYAIGWLCLIVGIFEVRGLWWALSTTGLGILTTLTAVLVVVTN
jgi:hypothetical protein